MVDSQWVPIPGCSVPGSTRLVPLGSAVLFRMIERKADLREVRPKFDDVSAPWCAIAALAIPVRNVDPVPPTIRRDLYRFTYPPSGTAACLSRSTSKFAGPQEGAARYWTSPCLANGRVRSYPQRTRCFSHAEWSHAKDPPKSLMLKSDSEYLRWNAVGAKLAAESLFFCRVLQPAPSSCCYKKRPRDRCFAVASWLMRIFAIPAYFLRCSRSTHVGFSKTASRERLARCVIAKDSRHFDDAGHRERGCSIALQQ